MNTPTTSSPQANFDIGVLYAGQFLKADDLAGKTWTASISAIEQVDIPQQDGSVRRKAAVTLQGWPARLLLNKVNFETIAAVYGRQSGGWLGKPLEVYPDTTFFSGRSTPCIRVRVPRPAASTPAFPTGAPAVAVQDPAIAPSGAPVASPVPTIATSAPPAVAPVAASEPLIAAALPYNTP